MNSYIDVTEKWMKENNPRTGNVDYDKNYSMSKDTTNERRNMMLIHRMYGGDIFAIEHTNYNHSTADYICNESYWELKNPKTLKGIDKLIQKAIKQISKNPGGIIVDCGYNDFSTDKIINMIERRLFRKENRDLSLFIVIVKNNKIILILRY